MLDKMNGFEGFSNTGDVWSKNLSSLGNSTGLSQAAYSGNSTFGVINEFKFLAARSIRTSTIILATFNTISAFATAAGILYDKYTTAKRSTGGKEKVNIFTCVRGPETYPFILSLGITIQGIVFAVAQAQGLNGLFEAGCSLVSGFMWPAIFIVPYIQLVFGLEVTFRALRKRPLPPRGKWDVTICLAVFKCLLLGTGLVAFFVRAPNFCFASLFWFVARWAEGGFVLLLAITIILTISGIIIFLKLTRYSLIENSERVGASRMVYYIATAVVSNALIVPFFLYLTFSNPIDDDGNLGLTLSMIATVVANVTGLMTGGLHLFLRSNTIGTIGPKNKLAEYERQKLKHKIRVRTLTEMDFNGHMLEPVPGPQSIRKAESQESLVNLEKGDDIELGPTTLSKNSRTSSPEGPDPLRSNGVLNTPESPRAPEYAQVASSTPSTSHSQKPSASYTLFPSNNQSNRTSVGLLPSTTYAPFPNPNPFTTTAQFNDFKDTLKPPPPIRAIGGAHRRNSSLASSATVQIGLRLSNVDDIGPMPMPDKVAPEPSKVYAPDYLSQGESTAVYRPSPLATVDTVDTPPWPLRPQDPASTTDASLPTVSTPPQKEEQKYTLNPTVYNPNSPTKTKTPSPKGVGFNMPRRANTTPVQNTTSPPAPRNRGNSSSAAQSRNDWI
ncbi:hypothetical protein F5B20DRAFT_174565 [Whalleya microplaca]|nr:hypothetical protein F5B20DRAFT_174565 [Whalleya microplaca]